MIRRAWAGTLAVADLPVQKRARTITLSSGGKKRDDALNPIIASVKRKLIALAAEHGNRKVATGESHLSVADLSTDELMTLRAGLLKAEWDESLHPRGDGGRFADGAAWPPANLTRAGVEDATSAWTGIHCGDLRSFMATGHVREGYSMVDDPLHGISEARAAQACSTLTALIANGDQVSGLYRGLNVDAETLQRFRSLAAGDTLAMPITSWSSDQSQANRFATGLGYVENQTKFPVTLQVADAQGFDMAKYSFYPQEKEWITNGNFEVVSVESIGRGLTVSLKQTAVWK